MMFDNEMIPKELVDYIDKEMNCDDILMSAMITKFMNDCGWPRSGGTLELKYKEKINSYEGMSKCQCESDIFKSSGLVL